MILLKVICDGETRKCKLEILLEQQVKIKYQVSDDSICQLYT
jgi:hypothetical protein